ncbi:UDP-N-acetylmuramoylalanyl-D-glutamate--2,6-diaminopimelate ligase [hydrothermal vent metagenome]|uniref:UDP-N-acetylmuramoylalanyl-D-glutamate--2,6-diaminopimelate ligase n=1 Tax=hydrothermal vent metagenome TaxID=652676 RepID=A0A3B0UEM7_9ZZZZ
MSHLLTELLAGALEDENIENIRVTGINSDSRAIAFGEAFFALPGSNVHGDVYSAKAVERGARVIVCDREPTTDLGVSTIIVENVRAAYAKAAMRASGPQPKTMMGITGTNGKTSVAAFVLQIWEAIGIKGATIGTLGTQSGEKIVAGSLTTPDPLTLHKQLAQFKSDGIEHVIMEASSHGLDQSRLDGIEFDVVGFTNLSRDHLDYHEDMDGYRDAKLRLFKELMKEGGAAVVNGDDPEHMPFLFGAMERGATPLSVGREGAYIEISDIVRNGWGQRITGKLVGEPLDFLLPLAGEFQALNAVVAAAMVVAGDIDAGGADKEMVIAALEKLEGARGRLEKVATHKGAAIFVDYAHTPDALKTALGALRPYATSSLKVVIGAGGDRDQGKRAQMGEIAAEIADQVIVTDDNPRTEDAAAIRAQVMEGAKGATEIGDRSEAIKTAIEGLGKGDVLLIAGKGHEDYQIIGTTKHPFSDHEQVVNALRTK